MALKLLAIVQKLGLGVLVRLGNLGDSETIADAGISHQRPEFFPVSRGGRRRVAAGATHRSQPCFTGGGAFLVRGRYGEVRCYHLSQVLTGNFDHGSY